MKTAGHRDGPGQFANLETEPNHAPSRRNAVGGRPILKSSLPALATWLEAGGLIGEWRLALGLEVRAAAAFAPLSVDLLSPGELVRYRNLLNTQDRRSWLTGRAALRKLLHRLDLSPDTAGLEFPRPDLALSHCGGVAVAIACLDESNAGLGVDLMAESPLHIEAARFSLTEKERLRLERRAALPESEGRAAAQVRLWTVKAALCKADPGNPSRIPADFEVADAALRRGKARLRTGSGPREFRYVSHRLAGWHLTLAAAVPLP